MDNATIVLLILGGIAALLINHLTSGPIIPSIIKESKDGATIEKCPHCKAVIGTAAKESVTWRISKKDTCPHCNKKIKR